MNKIQTIDVHGKEWFDKANGNSYFSCRITLDYGTASEKTIFCPFQYGYENQYIHAANAALISNGYVPENTTSLSRYCQDNGIELNCRIERKCKQRDVKAFGNAE